MEIENEIREDADIKIGLQIINICIHINKHFHSQKLSDMQLKASQLMMEVFTNHKAFKELDIETSKVNESYELAVCDMLALCFDPLKSTMDLKLRFAKLEITSPADTLDAPKPQGSKRKKR